MPFRASREPDRSDHMSPCEGPLGPTTFLMSWRRGYPDPAVPFLESYGTPSPLGTTELLGKLSARISSSQQVSVSGYAGRDAYTSMTTEPDLELSNNFAWQNEALAARWAGLVSPSLFMTASAAYTAYSLDLEHILSGAAAGPEAGRMASDFSIGDVSVRAQAEHFYDDRHTIRGGINVTYRQAGGTIQKFSTLIAPMSIPDADTWELASICRTSGRSCPTWWRGWECARPATPAPPARSRGSIPDSRWLWG